MLGVEQGKVLLKEYDSNWAEEYLIEKAHLGKILENFNIDIQHIGSTSIKGCIAKPIIDISIGVENLEYGKLLIAPLESAGYEYRGEAGVPGRLFLKKQTNYIQTYFIHIEQINSQSRKSHILFRDYLNNHPEDVKKYSELKRQLAKKYYNDRECYTEEKAHFIENILKKADML